MSTENMLLTHSGAILCCRCVIFTAALLWCLRIHQNMGSLQGSQTQWKVHSHLLSETKAAFCLPCFSSKNIAITFIAVWREYQVSWVSAAWVSTLNGYWLTGQFKAEGRLLWRVTQESEMTQEHWCTSLPRLQNLMIYVVCYACSTM